jgi:hypothetical protein
LPVNGLTRVQFRVAAALGDDQVTAGSGEPCNLHTEAAGHCGNGLVQAGIVVEVQVQLVGELEQLHVVVAIVAGSGERAHQTIQHWADPRFASDGISARGKLQHDAAQVPAAFLLQRENELIGCVRGTRVRREELYLENPLVRVPEQGAIGPGERV